MADDDNHPVSKLYLVEYERLKEEQSKRIGFRDNLIYVTLASLGVVAGLSLSGPGRKEILLLLSPVCVVLGWTYLMNDQKISAAGTYIREILAPRLKDLYGGELSYFAWESVHRADKRRKSRKLLQLLVDVVTFVAPGIIAVCAYWSLSESVLLSLVGGIEMLASLVLAWQIFTYADLRRDR